MGGVRERPVCHLSLKDLKLCKWVFVLWVDSYVKWQLWKIFGQWEQSFQKYLELFHSQCIEYDPRSTDVFKFKCYNLNGYMLALARACQRDASFWEEEHMW